LCLSLQTAEEEEEEEEGKNRERRKKPKVIKEPAEGKESGP
jgi:hypothetical protein